MALQTQPLTSQKYKRIRNKPWAQDCS